MKNTKTPWRNVRSSIPRGNSKCHWSICFAGTLSSSVHMAWGVPHLVNCPSNRASSLSATAESVLQTSSVTSEPIELEIKWRIQQRNRPFDQTCLYWLSTWFIALNSMTIQVLIEKLLRCCESLCLHHGLRQCVPDSNQYLGENVLIQIPSNPLNPYAPQF